MLIICLLTMYIAVLKSLLYEYKTTSLMVHYYQITSAIDNICHIFTDTSPWRSPLWKEDGSHHRHARPESDKVAVTLRCQAPSNHTGNIGRQISWCWRVITINNVLLSYVEDILVSMAMMEIIINLTGLSWLCSCGGCNLWWCHDHIHVSLMSCHDFIHVTAGILWCYHDSHVMPVVFYGDVMAMFMWCTWYLKLLLWQ